MEREKRGHGCGWGERKGKIDRKTCKKAERMNNRGVEKGVNGVLLTICTSAC